MTTPSSSALPMIFLLLLLLALLNGQSHLPDPPPPETAKELMVLIVEETAQRTVQSAKLLLSERWRVEVVAMGHRWRLVDQHAKEWDGSPARVLAPWRELPALQSGQSRGLPVVLLVSSVGRVLYAGSVPSSDSGVVELVRRYSAPKAPPM